MFLSALKASKGDDPDTPTWHQAMNSPQQDDWLEEACTEVKELEEHKTWTLWRRSDVPKAARVLPSTWVFKLKRFPDGRPKKFKARLCVQGDRQIEGIDYTDSYAPVVSWSTI